MAGFQRLLAARDAEELQARLAELATISTALGVNKEVIEFMETICTRSWEQVESLELPELQDVAAARRSIRAEIQAQDTSLWESFSRVGLADDNLASRQLFCTALKKVQAAKKLCKAEDERLFSAISSKENCAALQGLKDAHFACDSKGGQEELRAPFALLQSLKQAAVQFHQQSTDEKLTKAAKIARLQAQVRQQAETAQVELEDEQARAAASAQDAKEAQVAFTCLQAAMQDAHQTALVAQAAQAGCTFNLKRQLVDLRAQARVVAQQNASMEVERRAQLQSAAIKADAAEVEVKKLAARVVAQEELHGGELRKLQVDLEDEQARAAASAQDAKEAQVAFTCLQTAMQDAQQKALVAQAAQAGCTFSLKQQLVDLQAQVAQQNASVEAERRAQLQSATVKADAAELEVKKLAAQVGAQEELHGEELRHVQGQKDGIIHELRADLQLATDKLSIAEQDREMAMACLASAPRSHSTALHELQMQSSTTWEQNAKALADQMVGKDAQLKDISEYLATQTHEFEKERKLVQQLKEAKEQLRQKLAVLQERDEEHTQSLKDWLAMSQAAGAAQNDTALFEEPMGISRHAEGKGMTIQACKTDTRTKLQPSGTDLPRQLKHDHPQSENRDTAGGRFLMNTMETSCPHPESLIQDTSQPPQTTLSPDYTQGDVMTHKVGKAEMWGKRLQPRGTDMPRQRNHYHPRIDHRLSRNPAGSRSVVHSRIQQDVQQAWHQPQPVLIPAHAQVPARRQVHARLDQGQRARWSDAWAFVGMDGRSRGFVSNAMMMAFWIKSKKLLAQTLVYHASGGVQQGQALSKIHKQWRDNDELPSILEIQGLDADTAWAQLRVI